MKMHIKEFSELCGVSVRTLRYYDEIALLKPAFVDEQNGYRFYDEKSLERIQEILFYRELDFSLKSILEILSSPDYDKQKALKEQKKLLILKMERLQRIIDALDRAEKGKITMNAFDNNDYDTARKQYEAEAKERWGATDVYTEFEQKTVNHTETDFTNFVEGLDKVMKKFADCKADGNPPRSDKAQALVKELQSYITENYYTCSDEILKGLGQMYVADERFKKNIDKHAVGTAEFVSKAIEIYCK